MTSTTKRPGPLAALLALLVATALPVVAASTKPPATPTPPEKTAGEEPAGVAEDPGAVPAPESRHRHWERGNDGVNIGDDVVVRAGETHDGNIDCIRCHLTIAGHVNGDVVVVAGTLDLTGSVDGDVVTVVSHTTMSPEAAIDGALTNVAGKMERNGASVSGEVFNLPLGLTFPSGSTLLNSGWGLFSGFFFWWKLFLLFLFFVCALLLSALVPDRIRLISEETPVRLFTAFLVGLLGYMVLAMVQTFLFITVIGMPLVFLLYLVFIVLKWLAMCGIFHQIGTRVGRAFGREMSLLGGILLGLAPFAFLRFVPFCVGWSIWFLVEILAFGCLILTRVGTRRSVMFAPPRPPSVPPSATPVNPEAAPSV